MSKFNNHKYMHLRIFISNSEPILKEKYIEAITLHNLKMNLLHEN